MRMAGGQEGGGGGSAKSVPQNIVWITLHTVFKIRSGCFADQLDIPGISEMCILLGF